MLTRLAPAKVNLYLHVGKPNPNGRHPLDSLVVFAGEAAADRVSVEPADDLHLTLTGMDLYGLGDPENNLVLVAARALAKAARITAGAHITLDKRLPIAAGIGGGSTDAAATLHLLCDLWNIPLDTARTIAPSLGGDVPVALEGTPALMRGEGERVTPVTLSAPLPALLVNPGVPCSTAAIFTEFDTQGGGSGFTEQALPDFPEDEDGQHALINWLAVQDNDLEAPARTIQPAISDVLTALETLPDARLVRMSGSGATCFALFETLEDAANAAATLQSEKPHWWIRATELGAAP